MCWVWNHGCFSIPTTPALAATWSPVLASVPSLPSTSTLTSRVWGLIGGSGFDRGGVLPPTVLSRSFLALLYQRPPKRSHRRCWRIFGDTDQRHGDFYAGFEPSHAQSAGSRRVSVSVINEWGASAMASLLAAKVKQADRLFSLYRGCTVGLLWRVRVSNNLFSLKYRLGTASG